jgi:hypothetical protein
LEFDAEETVDVAESHGIDAEARGRLVTGVQALLPPIRIATNIGDADPVPAAEAVTPATLAAAELRTVRGLMAETPALVNYQVSTALPAAGSLRIGWIAALVLLAIALPALLRIDTLTGTPNRWPGVGEAFAAVQATRSDDLVVILWGYDPATAGELDLAMEPVMRHLLAQRTRPAVLSLLPGGVASARRLLAQVRETPRPGGLTQTAELGRLVTYTFAPGGAAVLPLLARNPAAIWGANTPAAPRGLPASPALVVVAAAQAEDVQQWLEQVQPLLPAPVIAVTAAGADPILRPYLASGQLAGLVSGFDGAYVYQRLLDPFVAPEHLPQLVRQIASQNWGHIAIVIVIALGNLAALMGREPGS